MRLDSETFQCQACKRPFPSIPDKASQAANILALKIALSTPSSAAAAVGQFVMVTGKTMPV